MYQSEETAITPKIVLFDFCETLTDFQTADAFVHYVERNNPNIINYKYAKLYNIISNTRLLSILNRLFPHKSIGKRCLLRKLKGMSKSQLESIAIDYYTKVIKSRLISRTMMELLEKQSKGFDIYIVSGGYDIYLKYFAIEYGIKNVISSRLKFKDGIFTGHLEGKDCMYKEKINRVIQEIPATNYSDWYAYSDSISDLPLLKFVGYPIVISKTTQQIWANQSNIAQIIWS